MSTLLQTPQDCDRRITELWIWKYYAGPCNEWQYLWAASLGRTGWIRRWIQNPETIAQHQKSACLMVARQFRSEIEAMGLNIIEIQDTLLMHDIAEPDIRVWDITPGCNISPEQKSKDEEMVIREMFWDNAYLLNLWLNFEYGKTGEWRISREIDKLQAIERASYYEELCKLPWLVEEFFTYAVVKKKQIQTDFLLRYAIWLYEDKAR